MSILLNPCKYSFRDLSIAAGIQNVDEFLKQLYSMEQNDINIIVKKLCMIANWYFEDIENNNIIYTSFSPNLI
jgi:hypothetical protein